MKFLILISLLSIIVSCGSGPEKEARSAKRGYIRKVLTEQEKQTLATTTLYYVETFSESDVKNCDEAMKISMIDRDGKLLVRTCKRVHDSCLMEGTCLVSINSKMQMLNVDGKVANTRRFRNITNNICRYGRGASSDQKISYKNMCVDPFYSVAADLKIYNLGDVIYLPMVKGTVLPNGEVHDGYFIVRDSGGNISGRGRFDFFTGFFTTKHPENPFTKIKLNGLQIFPEYFLVDGAEADRVRDERNFPLLPDQKND